MLGGEMGRKDIATYLLRGGRLEEARMSTENPAVKEKQYKEYHIE